MNLSKLFLACIAVLSLPYSVWGMNKAELIDAIASDAGLSKADAKRALESLVAVTQSNLKKGDRISLVGFGSFSVSKRAARTGRNPQTGKAIKSADAKNVVKFKAGSDLSKKVNRRVLSSTNNKELSNRNRKLAILDFQKPDKVIYSYTGNVTDEFKKAMEAGKIGHIDEIAEALEEFASTSGRIVAYDTPEMGIDVSLQVALEDAAEVPPSSVARFLISFRNVINEVLAEPCAGTLEDCDQEVKINGWGRFTAAWRTPINGRACSNKDQRQCELHVHFEALVNFGIDIIQSLRSKVLDRLHEEAMNLKGIARAALGDIDCYCISKCDGKDNDCDLIACDGIDNNCKDIPEACDSVDNNCDGQKNDCVRRKLYHQDVCTIKTQRKGAASGAVLIWTAEYCDSLAEEWGSYGSIDSLCGNLGPLVDEILDDYVSFFGAIGNLKDGTVAVGTRVRKGMQELKSLSQDIRDEVQNMKNDGR